MPVDVLVDDEKRQRLKRRALVPRTCLVLTNNDDLLRGGHLDASESCHAAAQRARRYLIEALVRLLVADAEVRVGIFIEPAHRRNCTQCRMISAVGRIGTSHPEANLERV